MSRMTVGEILGVVAFVVVIGYIFILLGVSLSTNAACLENGWASDRVTWNFKRYCVREENEYEITKPLSEILE